MEVVILLIVWCIGWFIYGVRRRMKEKTMTKEQIEERRRNEIIAFILMNLK